jgi:hypothetical protein
LNPTPHLGVSDILVIIGAITAAIVGVMTPIIAYLSKKLDRLDDAAHATKASTEATAKSIDGLLEKRTAEVNIAAFARGILQQKEKGEEIAHAVKEAQPPIIQIAQPPKPPDTL